jgi:peptidoglycan hydrolase-like protein with peptidoglycan-binding domain
MEILGYLHLALAYEAEPDATHIFNLESLKFFEWLKRQKLPTHVRIYLLSLVAILSILGVASEALAQRSLKLGDYSPDVTFIQQRLRQLGYFNKSPSRFFDSATRNAVIQFQRDRGLPADGIAGPRTQDELFAEYAQRRQTSNEEYSYDNSSYDNFNYNSPDYDNSKYDASSYLSLQWGDRGSNVRFLQERLREEGFYLGSIDGFFGTETEVAVRQFQRSRRLTVDGIAGQDTLAALEGDDRRFSDRRRSRREITLRPGSRGSRVEELQKNLTAAGFYRGPIDGEYGFGTTSAVRQLQRDNNLVATGVANQETLAVLEKYRYAVIIPNQKGDTLFEVRRLGFFNAFSASSRLGDYVNVGIFNNRALAESRSQLLRSRGLDARVAYSP